MSTRGAANRTIIKQHHFLLIFLLSLFLGTGSNAAEQEEWVYTMVQGDNLWNITERYLDDGFRYWNPLIQHNNVTDPLNMPPGTKIQIPVKWLKNSPATVAVRDIHGTVDYIRAGQTTAQKLDEETLLQKGDKVVVGEESNVALTFSDGSNLFLGSSSRIEMLRLQKVASSGKADSQIKLLSGRSESTVQKKGSRFQITTPSANTAVRGTEFRVAINESNPDRSQVEVLGGTVAVSGDKSERSVEAGFGTTVAKGEAPIPPVKLLPAPEIFNPPAYSRKLPVDIMWKEIDGAVGYRVLVREAEGEQTLLFDKKTALTRVNTSRLSDNKYIVGIRGVDENGLEGQETVYAFELDARPLPPLAITPGAGEIVYKKRPVFEWTTPTGGTGYHFLLSVNQDLSSPLVDSTEFTDTRYKSKNLDPGTYYWRLATLNESEEGPVGIVNSFIVRESSEETPEEATREDDGNITLRWQPGTEGQQYRVQLSSDTAFKEILREEVLQEPSWEIKRPVDKVYFRVRIIDVDGFEGDWSIGQ